MLNKLYLLAGKPIPIPNMGLLHQPTIDEILDYGVDEFNQLLCPYVISVDMLDTSDEVKFGLMNFDLLFFKTDDGNYLLNLGEKKGYKSYLDILKDSLGYFFNDEIEIREDLMAIKIGENGIVYRENFDELVNVILEANNIEMPKIEKPPKFENARQKDIWEKLQEGRKRTKERDQLNTETIYNGVVHGGKTFIPYREVKEMTMWQLVNTYKSVIECEQYDSNFKIMLTGFADGGKVNMTHWTERIKL